MEPTAQPPEQPNQQTPRVDGVLPAPQPVPEIPVKPPQKPKRKQRKATKAIAQTAQATTAGDSPDELQTDKSLVAIGQAAAILGVSVDTVRRWDKSGILHSNRPDGKNRYFSVDELERVKFAQPLTISEASEQLNISPSTLRRLEEKGMIAPQRNEAGERMYDREILEKFLHSDYFLRQREVEEEILRPLSGEPQEESSTETRHDPVAHAVIGEHHVELSRLKRFRGHLKQAGIVLGTALVAITALITVLFLLFPDATSKSLGYYRKLPNSKKYTFTPSDSILARQLKPFSQLSLTAIEAVSPALRQRVAPRSKIRDVNDVLAPDDEGNITSLYTFTVPDTSYLRIPDQGLVVNLNSDFLRGRVPGDKPGDLAILPIDGSQIVNGGINLEDLSDSARSSLNLANSGNFTVTTPTSSGDITDVIAGAGLTGGASSGAATLSVNLQGGSGMEASASGLSLVRSCAANQILKWNGSAWTCAIDGGGGSIDIKEGGTSLVNPAASLDFLGADFIVTPSGTEADIAVDYTNSGITRRNQAETIQAAWTMQQTLTFSGASTDIDTAVGEGLVLQGNAASSFNTTSGSINFNPEGAATGRVVIGSGTASATPDLLALDLKSTAGDPSGFEGAIYYNDATNKFRCFQNAGWTDCIASGGGGGSSIWSDLVDPNQNLTLNHQEFTSAFNWNTSNITSGQFDGFTLAVTNDGTSDPNTQRLLVLKNQNNGIVDAGSIKTEALLRLEHNDDSTLQKGIEIVGTVSPNGFIETAIDVSSGPIQTAINVGANQIIGTTGDIDMTNFDLFGSLGIIRLQNLATYTGSDQVTLSSGGGGQLILDSNGGQVIFANNDTFNIGGVSLQPYNAISNSTVANSGFVTDDNDLYVEGGFEVDGATNLGGNLTIQGTTINATSVTSFNCTDCIDFDDMEDALDLDAPTVITNALTGNFSINLTSTGDFAIQDASTTFATFTDTGTFLLDNLRLDGNTLDTTSGDLTLDSTGGNTRVNDNLVVTGTSDLQGNVANTTGNLVLDDIVDIGSATTGLRVSASGSILDIDGVLQLNDNVDITGTVSDSNSNLILDDTVDIGSATTGIRVVPGGSLSDIDGNLVLDDIVDIGSATSGLRVTTAGGVTDIDGTVNITDDADVSGILNLSGNTLTATADLTINPVGGQVLFGDTDVFNIGGVSALAYNAISNAGGAASGGDVSDDNDLYIQGALEVDGNTNLGGNFLLSGTFNCTDCIDWDDITDTMTLDAATSTTRTSTGNENSLVFNYINNGGAAGADNFVSITNAISANAAGDLNTEALLLIDQADTTAAGISAVDSGLLITNSGGSTISNAITIGSGSQAIGTGVNIGSTGITTDLRLQNAETVDNDTDGTIKLAYGASGGILLLTNGSSLSTDQTTFNLLNGTATTINFGGGATAALNIGSTTTGVNNFAADTDWALAGTENLTLANTTAAADQLLISATGITTANIDGLQVSLGTAAGAGAINSAIHAIISNAPVDASDIMNGLEVTGAAQTTASTTQNLIFVDPAASGNSAGTLNGINIDTITTPGAATENAIKLGQGYDTGLLLQATAAYTQVSAQTGINLDYATSFTAATGQNITGITLDTPALTATTSTTYKGLDFTTPGALVVNGAAQTFTFTGIDLATPNITQTAGTITSTGLNIALGSVTTGGTQTGLRIQGSNTVAAAGTFEKLINVVDGSGNSLFDVRDLSNGNNSFGAAATAGAFIGRNSYFGEEFNVAKPSCNQTSGTAGLISQARGDWGSSGNGATCSQGNGELNSQAIGVGVGGSCTASSPTVVNGVERLEANTVAGTATNARCLETVGTSAATPANNNLWSRDNLPVLTSKFSLGSTPDANHRFYIGLTSLSSVATAFNPGGVFASNCSTTGAAPTCDGNLYVVISNNTSGSGSISCGAITGGNTIYLRIEIRASGDIHAFADMDVATGGIVETECGSGLTTSPIGTPTALTVSMAVASEASSATNTQLNVDYVRVWQDDNEPIGGLRGEGAAEANLGIAQPDDRLVINLTNDGQMLIQDNAGQTLFGLDISGNATFAGSLTADALNIQRDDGTKTASIDQEGNVRANQIIGADLGESFATNDAVGPGDVVMMDGSGGVKKADAPYVRGLVGVATNSPALLVGTEEEGSVIVTLAGRVSVRVSDENGPIAAGDFLTSSSTPGVAMKSTSPGPVIGRAVIAYSGPGVGTTLVLVGSAESAGDVAGQLAALSGRVATLEADVDGLKNAAPASGQPDLTNLTLDTLTVNLDTAMNGGLTVYGNATFKGLTVFEKLATFIGKVVFRQDVEFEGRTTFNNDTAGYALVKTGQTKVEVKFTQPYAELPIVTASPSNGQFASYAVGNVTLEGFEIILQTPTSSDLTFSWVALSIKDAKVVQ